MAHVAAHPTPQTQWESQFPLNNARLSYRDDIVEYSEDDHDPNGVPILPHHIVGPHPRADLDPRVNKVSHDASEFLNAARNAPESQWGRALKASLTTWYDRIFTDTRLGGARDYMTHMVAVSKHNTHLSGIWSLTVASNSWTLPPPGGQMGTVRLNNVVNMLHEIDLSEVALSTFPSATPPGARTTLMRIMKDSNPRVVAPQTVARRALTAMHNVRPSSKTRERVHSGRCLSSQGRGKGCLLPLTLPLKPCPDIPGC